MEKYSQTLTKLYKVNKFKAKRVDLSAVKQAAEVRDFHFYIHPPYCIPHFFPQNKLKFPLFYNIYIAYRQPLRRH